MSSHREGLTLSRGPKRPAHRVGCVSAEKFEETSLVSGIAYQDHFEQSLDVQTWVALSPADWLFSGLAPAEGREGVATYVGTDPLPGVQFFRIVATPSLIRLCRRRRVDFVVGDHPRSLLSDPIKGISSAPLKKGG